MKRVTQDDIRKMNEAYLLCGTYSGVAKATGWSPSTVKKYIIPDYKSEGKYEGPEMILPNIDKIIQSVKENPALMTLSKVELSQMSTLWKEMSM